ncbi:MAG: DUF3795 domain-containing protein [Treponema sp.]|nr:DUF3795 domain-containing protein [Treponema sp.]
MFEDMFDTYCGLKCSDCEFKEKFSCNGCIASGGKPFHGKCEVADCAISKNKRFCGECENFPCEILKRYSFDKEHGDNGARIEHCKNLKAEMVKKARRGISPIGICGHHCDYCFLGQRCGGCRSDYNCCSYATLFEDKICPNVKCAKEKKLSGCYECSDIEDCMIGYYGQKNEYIAKATALFIKKHGGESYSKTLKRAIDAGKNYPKTFDAAGSVKGALELLEKYIG